MKDIIIVSAVCVYDDAGRLLTVRKRGTDKFMHPGGKPEPGETAAQAASRELLEEVGIEVPPSDLRLMGVWLATSFVGNFICGWLGSFWSTMEKPHFFLMIAAIAGAAGAVILALSRPLRDAVVER